METGLRISLNIWRSTAEVVTCQVFLISTIPGPRAHQNENRILNDIRQVD